VTTMRWVSEGHCADIVGAVGFISGVKTISHRHAEIKRLRHRRYGPRRGPAAILSLSS